MAAPHPSPLELPSFRAVRVAATPSPQTLVYLALHTDYSEEFAPTTELPEDKCGSIAASRLLKNNRGHYGPLEHPQLSLLLRADHNTIMQLRTHRVGCSFDVQSMRYTGERLIKLTEGELKVDEVFYVRPPGRYHDRQGDPYDWTEEQYEEQLTHSMASALEYAALRGQGVSEEQARFAISTNYYQNAMVSGSLRFWLHLLDVRSKADAQLEIRDLMELIADEVQAWCPEIYAWYASTRLGKALLAP
jgi:thymidylate synthase (FAD)